MEEQQLSQFQLKKYNTLMRRLEEERADQEKLYLQERRRLKQKYRNVLSQLKHEQRMTMQYFVHRWMRPLRTD